MKVGCGAFSDNDILDLINTGRVISNGGALENKHISSGSLDVTVAGKAYEIDRFLLPSQLKDESVGDLIKYMIAREINLGDVMLPGKQYLAPASVSVDLPSGVYAFANAKSSSGRVFLLSRIIVDGVGAYDTLIKGVGQKVKGSVWLLLEPMVFPIVLTDKECYSQIRFFDGDTRIKSEDFLKPVLANHKIILRQDGTPYHIGELSLSHGDGSLLSTLYAKAGKLVGFRAKREVTKPLDLTARGLDPSIYFDPIFAAEDPSDKDGGLIEVPSGDFYLLSTNEMIDVPASMCSELVMLDYRFGLFFSHFAGFFDPGFKGVPTLEVSSFRPMVFRHKQVIARFLLEFMRSSVAKPYGYVGNYHLQERTTLSKHFKMPEEWSGQMA